MEYVTFPFVSHAACNTAWTGRIDARKQVCAGAEGRDTCIGDSGGPLLMKRADLNSMVQLGVVSFGKKECGSGVPGVYTRVADYVPWIRRSLRP